MTSSHPPAAATPAPSPEAPEVPAWQLLGRSAAATALADLEGVRPDYEFLVSVGETYNLSTLAAVLSWAVRDQGRDEEALVWSEIAERASAPDDLDSQSAWRSVRAPILARMGNAALAEQLAREGLALARRSQAPWLQADALSELASVMAILNRPGEARQVIDEAIALYTAKGNVVSASRASAWAGRLPSV